MARMKTKCSLSIRVLALIGVAIAVFSVCGGAVWIDGYIERIDPTGVETIVITTYSFDEEWVPVDTMVEDGLEAMSDGRIEVRPCGACGEVCDINENDGIFGDPRNLERFVCRDCADRLSAREFYEKHLRA